MLVTTHLLTGAAIASLFPDPRISIPLAFASHFILDKIPHSQPAYKPWKVTKRVVILEVFDVLMGFSTLLIVTYFVGFTKNIWAGAIVAAMPDLDGFLYIKSLRKYLKTFLFQKWSKFHEGIQNETPKFIGKVIQVAIVLVNLVILLAQI